ncbi:MAG: LPS assembly protein LptD [Planctomycetes bacterium]|nr:LPS assembly protein LptD [Planctomycetota bacterium]
MRTIIRLFLVSILLLMLNVCAYAEGLLSTKDIIQRPFSLSANRIKTWRKDGIRVFLADKDVRIFQGPFQITADTAVCWFHEEGAKQYKEASVEVYCEGNITILKGENYEKYEQVYLRFETMTGMVFSPDIQPIETLEEVQKTEVVLRGEEIRAMRKEEYLSNEIPQKGLAAGISPKEEVVDIVADNIDTWEEEDKRIVVALGNVKIKKVDMTIDADSVILWFDQKESGGSKHSNMPLNEIYAEGNVTMRRKDDMQTADKIFTEVKEDKGIFINSKIATKPIKKHTDTTDTILGKKARIQEGNVSALEGLPAYVSADEVKQTGKGQYEFKNGIITTCGYGHPHYHFQGKKVRLVQRNGHNIVSSKGNSFYVGEYPVAYFPYISLDLQEKDSLLKDWEIGGSSRFGQFVRTDWDLFAATGGKQKDWSSLTLKADYLQKRGPATGFDFKYKGQDVFGKLDTYYLNDHGNFDVNNVPITAKDRGTVLWRHRQELPYDWRLDMEYSLLSDPRFLREFFPLEFKEAKDHETVMYLRRTHDTAAETILLNGQLNNFDTTVDSLREKRYAERLPEAAYRIIGEPLLDNRFIYSSTSSVTHFNSTFDQVSQTVKPQPVTRIDSVNRVSVPFKPGFFNINPFVEGRATGYTESIDTSGSVAQANGPATGRFIGSMGFDWSSTHWRSYSVYNDSLDINRLRHIFVPELRYIYSPVVTKTPSGLYQHDSIDALDSSQVVVMGVKNKLQTKRGEAGHEKTVDFVDFNADYYVFPTERGLFNDGINGIIIRRDNFVNLDFRSQLTDVVTFVSDRNEFNTAKYQFDVLTAGLEFYNPPSWQYFAGYRFIRDISSAFILGTDYMISEKWTVRAEEMYDLKSLVVINGQEENKPRNLRTNLMLSHYFHDWIGSLTLRLDPVRNDSAYMFDITPKGLQKKPSRFWF